MFPGAREMYSKMLESQDGTARGAARIDFYRKAARIEAKSRDTSIHPSSFFGTFPTIHMTGRLFCLCLTRSNQLTELVPPNIWNWNLASHGTHGRSRNVITPDDWNSFQAKKLSKIEQEQMANGTNVNRILVETG
jgi:hypothetical protein